MTLFNKHRVRATFYHIVAIIFLLSTALWALDLISDAVSFYVSATLFVVDYIAEMYDPNPEAPGPWFKAHFHRFFEDSDGDVINKTKCPLAVDFELRGTKNFCLK